MPDIWPGTPVDDQWPGTPVENKPGAASPFAGLLGLHQGAQDIAHGGVQLLQQLGGEDTAPINDLIRRGNEGFQDATRGAEGAASLGRFVGNVAAMPFPGARGALVAEKGIDAALKGGAAGSLLPNEDTGQRTFGALTGAVAGPVLETGAGYVTNKIANARAGNLNLTEGARKAKEFADKEGLLISADDLSSGYYTKGVGSAIDNVPIVGRGRYRELQNKAAEKAARDFVDELSGGVGDEPAMAAKDSAFRVLEQIKRTKTDLYNKAWAALDDAGEYSFSNTRQKAIELIAKEEARGSYADQALIKELQKAVDVPVGTMSFWHSIRSDIGSVIRSGKTGENAVIMDRSGGVLSDLKRTLDAEFEATANKIGGKGAALWRQADNWYKDKIVPYKKSAIKRAMDSDDYESVLNLIAGAGGSKGSDSASKAQLVYRSLDDTGRRAVVFAMVKKAFDGASIEGKAFHPDVFGKNLEAIEKRLNVFMPKDQRAWADGLQKYMRHISAAGSYAANPPTGRQLLPYAAAAGTVTAPALAAKVTLGVMGLKLLFNTERGKSLVLAMNRVTPESENAARIASEINAYLVRSGVVANDTLGR